MTNLRDTSMQSSRDFRCVVCRLRSSCLPPLIDDNLASRLGKIVIPRPPVVRGTYLFRQGEPRRSYLFLKSGSAKATILDEDGQENVICFYYPTDVVGAASMEREVYTESVIALERLSRCEIPVKKFEALCGEEGVNLHPLFAKISERINRERQARTRLNHHSSDRRVAEFLIEISVQMSALNRTEDDLLLTMSRYDIGSYLGLAAETVSRVLKRLAEVGAIGVHGKNVQFLDRVMLERIAQAGHVETEYDLLDRRLAVN